MKYIKLFEDIDFEFEIGDFVRIIVDELEIGAYDVTDDEKCAIFKVDNFEEGWINIESYYYFDSIFPLRK